jgi:hypothetical protein
MRKLMTGIALLLSTGGAAAAPEQAATSKLVSYQGGLVVFSVPKSWVKEDELEGGEVFHEPGDKSGTLRVSVTSAKLPVSDTPLSSKQVLSKVGFLTSQMLPNGNAISKELSRETEQGRPITIFEWCVAGVVGPGHVRVATFSYTILSSEEHTERTVSTLSEIENSIRNTRFSPVVEE